MGLLGELRRQRALATLSTSVGTYSPARWGEASAPQLWRCFVPWQPCLGWERAGPRGTVAVPGPRTVPAPSPTAAISSSRSGSARAAGINQPGGTTSAEPMRSGRCHGDAGRC